MNILGIKIAWNLDNWSHSHTWQAPAWSTHDGRIFVQHNYILHIGLLMDTPTQVLQPSSITAQHWKARKKLSLGSLCMCAGLGTAFMLQHRNPNHEKIEKMRNVVSGGEGHDVPSEHPFPKLHHQLCWWTTANGCFRGSLRSGWSSLYRDCHVSGHWSVFTRRP